MGKRSGIAYYYKVSREVFDRPFSDEWWDDLMEASGDYEYDKDDKHIKIPIELIKNGKVKYDFEDNMEDCLMIAIACWIYTYSRKTHATKITKLVKQFPQLKDKKTTKAIMERIGKRFLLSYDKEYDEKDQRNHHRVKFDFDKYKTLIGKAITNKNKDRKENNEVVEPEKPVEQPKPVETTPKPVEKKIEPKKEIITDIKEEIDWLNIDYKEKELTKEEIDIKLKEIDGRIKDLREDISKSHYGIKQIPPLSPAYEVLEKRLLDDIDKKNEELGCWIKTYKSYQEKRKVAK